MSRPTTLRRASALPVQPQPYAVRCVVDMLPPSVNHMYVALRRGGKALSEEAQTFRQLVALALRGQPTPPAGLLILNVWLTFPNKRSGDGDNRIKAAQDAIALALGFNDRQITEWHVYVDFGKQPRCEALLETRIV